MSDTKRPILQSLTSENLFHCEDYKSKVVDIRVYIEDPYVLIKEDYERTNLLEEELIYEVELSHFISNCKEGNPNYVGMLREDNDNVSYISHEFLDLLEIKKFLISKELSKKIMYISEKYVMEDNYCMAQATMKLAIGMLDKADVISVPRPTEIGLNKYKELVSIYESKFKGSGLRPTSDFMKVDDIVTKIRKSIA